MPPRRIILWGLEKHTLLKALPEGLYLLALSLRRAGWEARVRLLPRSYVDQVQARLEELRGAPPAELHRGFDVFEGLAELAGGGDVLFHGLQTYEGDINYLLPLVSFLRAVSPAPIVCGGALPTLAPGVAMAALGPDYLLRGECEGSVVGLARALRDLARTGPQALEAVPGLAWPDGQGGLGLHPRPDLPTPIPACHDDLDYLLGECEACFGPGPERPMTFFITFSRGCPKACIFCTHANGRAHRCHDLDSFARRLTRLGQELARVARDRPGFRCVLNFGDDDFLLNRAKALRLLEGMAQTGLADQCNILYATSVTSLFRGRRLDQELLAAIKASRPSLLQIGTDAFIDQEIAQIKNGAYSAAMVEEVIAGLEEQGVTNNHFWILSGPGTTLALLVEHLARVWSLYRAYRRFHITWPNYHLMPLLGSPLRQMLEERGDRRLLVERPTLRRGPQARGLRFYDRVEPADPLAAGLLERLRRDVQPELMGTAPYGFDFQAALEATRAYLDQLARTGAPAPVLARCRHILDAAG